MKTFTLLLAASVAVAQPSWFLRSSRTNPANRSEHAMAFDSLRGRLVMVGGNGPICTEAWERDSIDWTGVQGVPGGVRFSAAVFDSARGRTVLFVGQNCPGSAVSETWEWNGTAWTQRLPAISPSGRYAHAMAFDSARNRTVLYGGYGGGNLSDTWEWDGTAWTQRTPATSPPARFDHAMAFDSNRNRVVLFGGNGLVTFNDTWEYDGTNWTQRFVGGFPAARAGHAMAFDPLRGRTVLYGGSPSSGRGDETWEWDGSSWAQIAPTVSPPPSVGHAMAYDSARSRMVLFGGSGGAGTWEYWSPPAYCRFLGSGHLGGGGLELTCVDRPAIGTTFRVSFVNSPTWAASFNLLYLGLPTAASPFNSPAVCSGAALLYVVPFFVFQVLGNPAVFPIGVPNEPALVGQAFGFQGGSFEISGCFRLTDGVAITVQQ